MKIFRIITVLLLVIGLAACNSKEDKKPLEKIKPGFEQYISGYTSGNNLSRATHFVIRLAHKTGQEVKDGAEVKEQVFDFDPAISGKTIWVDERTLEFIPERLLESGKTYRIRFHLDKLMKVAKGYEEMAYEVRTMEQSFVLSDGGLRAYDNSMELLKYEGSVRTADVADTKNIQQMLRASIDGQAAKVQWKTEPETYTYHFSIDSIRRMEQSRELKIEVDGEPIGVDNEAELEKEIPSLGEFVLLSIQVQTGETPYVTIRFSDPLDETQNLKGMVYFTKDRRPAYQIEGSILKVYPSKKLKQAQKIFIAAGIKNRMGYKTKEDFEQEVNFESNKPRLEKVGKGVIMPTSEGLIFPFRAVSLKMVDLKIIQIYENNILSFLQENTFDESSDIRYFGRLIYQNRIDLQKLAKVNLNQWNTFKLDLANYIEIQPGAIYRVKIEMRPAYSNYACDSSHFTLKSDREYAEEVKRNMQSWDNRYDSYGDDYWDYDWRERDNPCNPTYYRDYWNNRSIEQNIFASNLGIITKGSPSNNYVVVVTDLRSTDPVKGAEVVFYNLQRQIISRSETNNLGICNEQLDSKPYFVVVKKDDDYGYLRLGNNDALSTSNFNVSGMRVQHGIKAFIYGERGVWRPGDNIYITMILDDPEQHLPADYPVVFDLYNPMGQNMQHEVLKNSVNDFYSFHIRTDADAPTGIWHLKVKVGGAVFTKSLRIETVKPNRLTAKIEYGDQDFLTKESLKNPLRITAKWLHGSPASNLDVKVSMSVKAANTKFKKFETYNFKFPGVNYKKDETIVFDGKLNAEGKAKFFLKIAASGAPGMLKAHFVTRVFEKSGDFSILTQDIKYSPYTNYVGLRMQDNGQNGWYKTDMPAQVNIATVDQFGNPVARRNVKISVYKVRWRWWWESSNDNLAQFMSGSSSKLVSKAFVNTGADGRGTVKVEIKYRSYEDNGRYLIVAEDPVSGHKTGITVYFSKWYGRLGGGSTGATILSFSSDKDQYKVGEEVQVKIPSSKNGRALVSIESGSRILDVFWVPTNEGETNFSFPATAEMAPNIFVHVSLIQPHAQTINDNPIRMYGIIPVEVINPETRLQPEIGVAKSLEPEKEFEVRVSEKSGKAMTYTLAIVDEGLLDLTNFRTPDPWKRFYAREALGVRSWDMYDYVIGAYGARLEKAFAIGGDGTAPDPSKNKANRFKPVVIFAGPFNLDKGETAKHNFKMPNYIGSVRVMVVAGNQGAYGNAEKAVPVKKDLMLLATLPRVLGPGEEVVLPVTVFAMNPKVKDVKLHIKVNDMAAVASSNPVKIHFGHTGDKTAYFRLKVGDKLGIVKVQVFAESGNLKARYDLELDVRSPNPPMIQVFDQMVEPGAEWSHTYRPFGLPQTNALTLEVSSIPPMGLERRIEELIDYPHGCIEQVTSRILPQLFLPELTELTKEEQERVERNIKEGINSLRKYQLASGGFSYWPGSTYESEWGTSYAGHMLLLAQRKGYSLPPRMLANWIIAQRNAARAWTGRKYFGAHLNQAYRLYTLALAGDPDLGAMNRMSQYGGLNARTTYMLALAYAEAGQSKMARKLISSISLSDIKSIDYYRDYSFGSEVRDLAIHLLLLNKLGAREQGFVLMKRIAGRLDSPSWMSTQTTAFSLMAISDFYQGKKADKVQFAMRWNNQKSEEESYRFVYHKELDVNGQGNKSFSFTNTSTGPLYVRLIQKGTPKEGMEQARSSNLQMSVRYVDLDGNSIDPVALKQGTDFKAIVEIKNPGKMGDYTNLALTEIFPSGWEIINTRMTGQQDGSSAFKYRDIRDDRVMIYFDLPNYRSVRYVVLLNAAYEGRYYLPGVKCQAMYEYSIGAQQTGKWVEVLRK